MDRGPQNLINMLEPVINNLGYELVGIDYRPHPRDGLVRIYIDAEQGITLDDCSAVSHQVSGVLDVEDPIDGQYNLEVSSPGLDRPLFCIEHFIRFAGQKVKLAVNGKLDGRRRFFGPIKSVDGETITIAEETGDVLIPFDRIEKANLIPEI